MKKLFKYILPYRMMISFTLILKLVAAIAELFLPKIMAFIIDELVPAERAAIEAGGSASAGVRHIVLYGLVMLAFALLALVGNIVANCLATRSAAEITQRIRADLFRKTTALSARQVDRMTVSSLISRLTSDSYYVNEVLAMTQRMGIRAPVLLVGGLLLTLTLDPVLTLVLAAVLPLIVLVVTLVTKRSIPIYKDEQETLDEMVRVVQENAAGVRVIKALSKTEHEKERFCLVSGELSKRERRAGRLMSLTNPLTSLILNLGFCVVLVVGAYRVASGDAKSGMILAFLTYFTIILNAMLGITRIFVRWSRGIASAGRIGEVLAEEEDMPVIPSEPVKTDDHITFENVSFSYNRIETNLDNLSFSLGRGQTLGIIGATGSGKSTLISLLVRFYDADSGTIRIDGRDIRSIPVAELRSKLGVVFQNDFLVGTDIRENIDFYRGRSDREIEEAAAAAQASEFIEASEEGYARPVTSRGTNLSGGQKQRLLVARALAGDPEILILDDSSSALDYKTDMLMRRAIRERNRDTTTIIVAQRVSAIRHADLILVLDDGRVIGRGTHDELMRNCEIYRSIGKMQMGGEADE
jgi:ATP-binding cassette subfamily B protein